ncbi:hypothetical protein EYF80_054486 [Liparis tanakae]|uniref:Uncharacterized protein n=1 Tax=Liparis tanakae TaxID=230148 RepID=A0A4Z2F3K6_9TELE|nr:hypothetical protein EYF80_054486 [Liparis tanakae]
MTLGSRAAADTSCFPSRQANSLHLPLVTSLVPRYLHLVLTSHLQPLPSLVPHSLHLVLTSHLQPLPSLVPHYLHLVLLPFSPAAPPLVSPSLPSPGPHALLTCSPSPR